MVRLLIGSVGAASAGLSPIIARFDSGINRNPRYLPRRDVALAERNQQWTNKGFPMTDHRTCLALNRRPRRLMRIADPLTASSLDTLRPLGTGRRASSPGSIC